MKNIGDGGDDWSEAQIERVRELAKAGYHCRYVSGDLGIGSAAAARLAQAAGVFLQWGAPGFLGDGFGSRTYASWECEDLPDV